MFLLIPLIGEQRRPQSPVVLCQGPVSYTHLSFLSAASLFLHGKSTRHTGLHRCAEHLFETVIALNQPPKTLIINPAAQAEPMTPATLGPIACISRKLEGFSFCPTTWDTRAAIGTADTPAEPISGLTLPPVRTYTVSYTHLGVARAFAVDPPIVLMDEPFSALDPMTRAELQDEIHTLQKKTKKTVVFVTHDMDEAIKLAYRICINQEGHIVQCDTPERILKAPANQYVTDFIGANRLWANPEYIRAQMCIRDRPQSLQSKRRFLG